MGIMAAAYFDESNDHQRAYGVGGFLGNQFDCVHLEWAWREHILEKYGLKYFKASELEYGFGEFAKFRDDPNNFRHPNLRSQLPIGSPPNLFIWKLGG